jgi:ATP-dependent DNA helicase RecG
LSECGSNLANIPVTTLAGVGPRTAEHLLNLGITTVQDLLFHLPLRYEDRTCVTALGLLQPGSHVLVQGEIQISHIVGGRRKSLVCRIHDGSGSLKLRFFHFTAAQRQRLGEVGNKIVCFGEVRKSYQGGLEMVHPEYRHILNDEDIVTSEHLTPIYPATKGLSQHLIRKLMAQALALLKNDNRLVELLPSTFTQTHQLGDLKKALLDLHAPTANKEKNISSDLAKRRLVFEELLAHQLALQSSRLNLRQNFAPALQNNDEITKKFLGILGFKLTTAQQRVAAEINSDLAKRLPMLRLVQGDVGSGKTVVAALAVLQAVASRYQAAIMAPTELLAEQHCRTFKKWFLPLGIEVGWLSGKQSNSQKEEVLIKLKSGAIKLIIGTHALFQTGVEFNKLALLVVDEQHRFGVQQRLALQEKGTVKNVCPHQLVMTATPIPRTLAMTAYSDLDVSVIDELPAGRKPVNTVLISNERRDEVVKRVYQNCCAGRQAYWVCTVIDESEVLQCQAAQVTADSLKNQLPQLRIGLIHGRLKADEKEQTMQAFLRKELDLLVATTVIEVGVDVPNASLMIIENAERLGLAQLHQLRGRVGRGSIESYCVLLYQTPLSKNAKQRLAIMRQSQDGFVIAEKDLTMRGPGELLGTRQAGLMQFKIADLLRDQELLPVVNKLGQEFMQKYPENAQLLIQRWVGLKNKYVAV